MAAKDGKIPLVRWLRTGLRTLHIAAFSVFLGGTVLGAAQADIAPWLFATGATGLAFVLLEISGAPVWLRQLRGVAIMVKLALLGAAMVWRDGAVAILFLIVAISSLVSHMPGKYRYKVIFGPDDKPLPPEATSRG